MADKKISQLTALAAANLAPSTDVLAIVDTSATETKKIVAQDLINGVLNVASSVGIGTASPASKLDTAGTIRATSQTVPSSGTGAELFYDATNAGLRGYNRTGSAYVNLALNDNVYIGGGSSGNVGIGTASPGAKLHVLGSNLAGIFAGTNANTVYTEYRYNSTTTSGFIGNGSSILSAAADSDFIVRSEGALKFATNGNNFRAVIDTSGNLGLGVTPSAWGLGKAIEVGNAGNSIWGVQANDIRIGANMYYNGSVYKYINATNAAWFGVNAGGSGGFSFNINNNTPSAGGTATFTQAMTLDASGNLGVGITSPNSRLDVVGGTGIRVNEDGSSTKVIQVRSNFAGVGPAINVATNDPLLFQTNNTERGRFTAGGFFKASNTGTYASSTSDRHELRSDKNDINVLVSTTSTGASVVNVYSQFPASPNAGAYHFAGVISGSGYQFTVDADGDVKNTNGSYAAISDLKLKQDIEDAASQWDDIKSVRVRKYRFKRTPDAPLQIGVIAQELEQTSPGLVSEDADRDEENNDLGTTTKSVKYSILYMKAIKALQEAMARIESLEADMAALKGAK